MEIRKDIEKEEYEWRIKFVFGEILDDDAPDLFTDEYERQYVLLDTINNKERVTEVIDMILQERKFPDTPFVYVDDISLRDILILRSGCNYGELPKEVLNQFKRTNVVYNTLLPIEEIPIELKFEILKLLITKKENRKALGSIVESIIPLYTTKLSKEDKILIKNEIIEDYNDFVEVDTNILF